MNHPAQQDPFEQLTQALKHLPSMSAPPALEANVWAAIAVHNAKAIKRQKLYSALHYIVILSAPLWLWLAIQSQHWFVNKILWQAATLLNSNQWLTVYAGIIHSLTTLQLLSVSYVLAFLGVLYLGCGYGLLCITRTASLQGITR
jgi:hypothetical protein